MRRRQYIAVVAAGVSLAGTGCLTEGGSESPEGTDTETNTPDPTAEGGSSSTPSGVDDLVVIQSRNFNQSAGDLELVVELENVSEKTVQITVEPELFNDDVRSSKGRRETVDGVEPGETTTVRSEFFRVSESDMETTDSYTITLVVSTNAGTYEHTFEYDKFPVTPSG